MNISTKALRTRVREVLECLDRGERVTLTYRGKPRARLVGIDESDGSDDVEGDELPAFGMWRDRDDLQDVPDHLRRLRRGRFDVDRY